MVECSALGNRGVLGDFTPGFIRSLLLFTLSRFVASKRDPSNDELICVGELSSSSLFTADAVLVVCSVAE